MEALLNYELEEIERLQNMVKALQKSNGLLHKQCMELMERNEALQNQVYLRSSANTNLYELTNGHELSIEKKCESEKGSEAQEKREQSESESGGTSESGRNGGEVAVIKNEEVKPEEWNVRKKVRKVAGNIKRHEFVVRAQTRMLMKLYEYREFGIEPAVLFLYSGVKKVTGYRYVSFFKKKKYLAFIGARQKGKYILTRKGAGFLMGDGG